MYVNGVKGKADYECKTGSVIDLIWVPVAAKGVNGECIAALGYLFKRCYETEEIPEEWERGLVVPIAKTTDGSKSRTTGGFR